MTTRALVLGGGGVAGIAWEFGLLTGWAADGVDVSDADLVVGTSAGSIVGALLRTGADLQERYEAQLGPVPASEPSVQFHGTAMLAAFGQALAGVTGEQEARARIGQLALRAATVPEGQRRAIIASRIGDPEWPSARLIVTAVDTADGAFQPFDTSSGVRLLDAVAASCAVPSVWPPITIGDRRYMDGGMRSITNADLATGCGKVLVVSPTGGFPNSPLGPTLDQEVEQLRRDADVHVVLADDVALAAFGTNPLDPATREPSAKAGRAQASDTIDAVRVFWGVTSPEWLDRPRTDPVELHQPSPQWAGLAAQWMAAIEHAVSPLPVRLEHVGSTAVPGLLAKPVLDLQLSVPDLDAEEDYRPALESLGLVLRVREPGHRYFRPPEGTPRTVHVHVCRRGSTWEREHLAFRDRLRQRPDLAAAYAELKQRLAAEFRSDRIAYTDGKSEFVRSVLESADDDVELAPLDEFADHRRTGDLAGE